MASPSLEIYPPEKERANKETIWEHYFARQIAFFFAPFFLKRGISANQISFLSIAAGIAGATLIMFGNFWVILAGAILMQAWLVFDKTDGIIARARKTPTKFGEFLEEFNGSLIAVLFFIGAGFAAAKFPGFFTFGIADSSFIFLGIGTALFVSFRHLAAGHFQAVFEKEKKSNFSGKSLYRFVIKFSGVYSLAQPIFILAVIFNFIGLYSLAYFVIQGVLMVVSIASLILKAHKT